MKVLVHWWHNDLPHQVGFGMDLHFGRNGMAMIAYRAGGNERWLDEFLGEDTYPQLQALARTTPDSRRALAVLFTDCKVTRKGDRPYKNAVLKALRFIDNHLASGVEGTLMTAGLIDSFELVIP